jgi:hypothetical protein
VLLAMSLFVMFAALAVSVSAGVGADQYEKLKSQMEFKVYIKGLTQGFEWANTCLESRGQKRLYCAPSKPVLETENYLRILDDRMKDKDFRSKVPPDIPIEAILLFELQEMFPCK